MIESLAKTYIAPEHCPLHPYQNLAGQMQVRIRLMRRCICMCRHRRLQVDYHASVVCTPCQYPLSSLAQRTLLASSFVRLDGSSVIRARSCEDSSYFDPCRKWLDLIWEGISG
jgi:hypothetical protein